MVSCWKSLGAGGRLVRSGIYGERGAGGGASVLPPINRGSICASRNLSRAAPRRCVISDADAWQNPSAVKSGSSRIRGRV